MKIKEINFSIFFLLTVVSGCSNLSKTDSKKYLAENRKDIVVNNNRILEKQKPLKAKMKKGATVAVECGNGFCQEGEDSSSCSIDCKLPDISSSVDFALPGQGWVRPVKSGDYLLSGLLVSGSTPKIDFVEVVPKTGKIVKNTTIVERDNEIPGSLGNPQPFLLPSGRLLMAYRDHYGSQYNRTYRLRVSYSDDQGNTWHTWSSNKDGIIDQGSEGLWEPFFYLDKYSNLRIVYAKEHENNKCFSSSKGVQPQDIVMKVSNDNGKTWTDEAIVASKGRSRDGVPSVARLQDGSFVVVFESWRNESCENTNPKLVIRAMQSIDGVTWTKRQDIYIPNSKGLLAKQYPRATWPYITQLNDGRVAVLFTTDEEREQVASKGEGDEGKPYEMRFLPTKGGSSFENLQWDYSGMKVVFPYIPGQKIRYSSAMQFDNNLLIFSAQPSRYKMIPLKP